MTRPEFDYLWRHFYSGKHIVPLCILYQEYTLYSMILPGGSMSPFGSADGQSLDGTILQEGKLRYFTWEV